MLKKLLKSAAVGTLVLSVSACGVSNAVTSSGQFVGEPRHESFESTTFNKKTDGQVGIMVSGPYDPILKRIKIGTSKEAIMYGGNSLGPDHYNAGFGSKLLTYNFSNENGWRCQIKYAIGSNNKVGQISASPAGCATQVEQRVPEEIVRKVERQEPQVRKINLQAGAWFNFDSDVLRQENIGELRRLAQAISQMNTINRIVVVGHTDQSGTDAYNQQLSERRAKAVANFLVAHGAPATNMHVVGMGEAEPVKDCGNPDNPSPATKACNFENRRVVIYVDGSVGQLADF